VSGGGRGSSFFVFAALIIATGCGAFLNLSDEDDPIPAPSPEGGGASSGSTSSSSSSSSSGAEPQPDAAGNGEVPITPDAAPDEDVKIGNFGLRVATFEDQALVGVSTGMDQQLGFEIVKNTGLTTQEKALLGEHSAHTLAMPSPPNDSRIWYVINTPQLEVDFSFILVVNALPQNKARVMHLGSDAPINGIDLHIDAAGGMHFTATGNAATDFSPTTKLQNGSKMRVWLRLSQTRGDARIAVTDIDKLPAQLTLLTWPQNVPISIAVVGRVANPGAVPQGNFNFDQVRLGPPGTIIPGK
jgi:hypothetical protein